MNHEFCFFFHYASYFNKCFSSIFSHCSNFDLFLFKPRVSLLRILCSCLINSASSFLYHVIEIQMYDDIKFRSRLPRWYLQVANLSYIVLAIRFNTWLQLPNIVTRLGWLTVYKFIRRTKLIDEQWTPILGPLIQHKDKVVMCSPFYQELRTSIACNFD